MSAQIQTKQIQIRAARGSDAEAVLAMIVEHAAFEGEKYDPQGKIDSLREGLDKQTDFECLVVVVDERVEGYCTYMPHYDSWFQNRYLFVDGLWLNEPPRGASIGTQIFERLHKRAAELNCESIQVMTPSTNDSGIRFYRKIGAREHSKAYFYLPVQT